MKILIACLIIFAAIAQDFGSNPRKSSSGLQFDDSRELLSYMHIKQHKMEDHYVKQVATLYIFYNINARDADTKTKIENWRSDVLSSIKDMGKYIDIEEIIVDDIGYDDLLGNYNISGVDLKSNPFVMIDEFDERVWVYRLDQTDKIKERIKTILSEGISYFNY